MSLKKKMCFDWDDTPLVQKAAKEAFYLIDL